MTERSEVMNEQSADLSGRTAVVTGAASGIGRACAVRLAAAGARVVVVDRDAAGANDVAEEVDGTALVSISPSPPLFDGLTLDADILVNSAGLQHIAPVEEFPPERFALLQRVMLEAPFRLAQLVIPGMYARGWGRLVHISSVHGHRASAYKAAYVAAKHGLEGLSKVSPSGCRRVSRPTPCVRAMSRTPLVEGQVAARPAHGIPKRMWSTASFSTDAGQATGRTGRGRRPRRVPVRPGHESVTGASFHLDGGWTAG